MRIGIMLRHFDQHGGGVRVYTHNLIRELIALQSPHHFTLLYRDPKHIGTYSGNGHAAPNIREVALPAKSNLAWDQYTAARAAKREKLDLLFNPKYALPLLTDCPCVFVCHGLDWYVMPWGSKWLDRMNHRYLIPRYAQKAKSIITVSNTTRDHVIQYLHIDPKRLHTVYHGVDEAFTQPIAPEQLAKIKKDCALPDRYFLYVGQVYPPKNVGRLLRAYAQVGPQQGVHLVMAGEHRWLSANELHLIDTLNLHKWVIQTGWVARQTLPAFYQQALALVLPSLYESFGIPLLEAMAARCPIVTADCHGTRELAHDVGILVDPHSVESIAAGLQKILDQPSNRQAMIDAGTHRVKTFSWKKCARQTLDVLESV